MAGGGPGAARASGAAGDGLGTAWDGLGTAWGRPEGRPGAAGGRPGAAGDGSGRPGAAGRPRGAPGDQYLENRRRRRKPERDLSEIRWPFLTEGLSKVDVSAKNYFLGRHPDTIVFLQPSVSPAREATF